MCVCFVTEAAAVKFDIRNQCGYTVWAAGLPGGGQQLTQGQTWTVNLAAGTQSARFWGRTGCSFDASGKGTCQTGDCGGQLSCTVSGAVPATLAEYTQSDQDYYDVSLVDGFNIPLSINPTNAQCTAPACKADVNAVCPAELKVAGGCKSACVAFQTDQYYCTGSYTNSCPATNYSMIFKQQCPQAYSYAKDDTATFAFPSGTDYTIVFCP
ncbi:pathogenesis-related thaumatin-like protein 3.8 [Cryptomeria japonica]|uniref:pathogenesis-related thaumatin-like protein 3.8 n=1 Tax=Cryptomeria japonica TaxID=3369 RepID=UPI0027D9DBF2|nr:pathogenesis-related thaumatin-like protein 3.8 [Cryptomeria japonica]XP_057844781.2 pathogenesis-related thaumatin-like protein 3.8 [Cryptomeria japonica]